MAEQGHKQSKEKYHRAKLKSLDVVYSESTAVSPEGSEQRLERAFDMLFEATIKKGIPQEAKISFQKNRELAQGVKIK